jgi:hypothetical protein
MIASTPSLNASRRVGLMCLGSDEG